MKPEWDKLLLSWNRLDRWNLVQVLAECRLIKLWETNLKRYLVVKKAENSKKDNKKKRKSCGRIIFILILVSNVADFKVPVQQDS